MCYNPEISGFFFLIGISVTAYVYLYVPFLRKTQIHYLLLFYSLMELLQSIQYFYVNQCDNIINVGLTEIAYSFTLFQPLIWNIFFYINSNPYEKYIFSTAIWLCLFWIFMNVVARLSYNYFPSPQTIENSVFASDKVCTRKLNSHLYWTWTAANLYDLNANYLSYLMLWFIPALTTKSKYPYILILILGGLFSAFYGYKYDINEIGFTFTAAWCFISVPIVLAVMAKILYNNNINEFKKSIF